jgi:hypothetical protein
VRTRYAAGRRVPVVALRTLDVNNTFSSRVGFGEEQTVSFEDYVFVQDH